MGNNLIFDPKTISISENGKRLDLTLTEMRILNLLMQEKNNVVSREDFQKNVWHGMAVINRCLDVHIYRIRKRLKFHTINCVVGKGYNLWKQDVLPGKIETMLLD